MKFLVTGEWVEVGALMGPGQIVGILGQTVIPSLDMLAQWEQEGKVHGGGIYAGERAGAWIFEAESSEELGQLLSTLPFWGQLKWHVRPLQSTGSAAERERSLHERVSSALAQAAQQGG